MLRITIGLFLLIICAAVSAQESGTAYGEAYTLDGAHLLYTELHQWDGITHTIEYRKPDGTLIADSHLDFSNSLFCPNYEQHYAAGNYAESARWHNGQLILFSDGHQKIVAFRDPLVISSGFYHFIRSDWSALIAGAPLSFDFAVPSKLIVLRLHVYRVRNDDSAVFAANSDLIYFRVDSIYPWLRWLVPPLTVAFDVQKRLIIYRGISNVRDEDGALPQVLIRYRYPAPT